MGAVLEKNGGGPGEGQKFHVCCEDIFNDENTQRPPQFHEGPRKLKKEGRERKKKQEILDGPGQGTQPRGF